MDQLKGVSVAVTKYLFWVLCVIVVLGAVVVWQVSATSGDSTFAKGKKDLNERLDAVKTLADAKEPHNDQTLEEIRQRQVNLSEEVWNAWNNLYIDQKTANQWPSELGEAFRVVIDQLKWGDEIPLTQRYEYGMFIKKCLPRLAHDLKMRMTQFEWDELEAIIKGEGAEPSVFKKPTAKKSTADAQAEAAKKALDPSHRETTGLVVWDDYAKFQDHFTWQAAPSPLEVWLAQEDLWVYQALLQIIVETNQGAGSHSSAPVKRIISMDIAQNAAVALAGAQSGYGTGMGMGMPSGYSGASGASGMPGGYSGSGGPSGGPGGYSGSSGPSGGPGGYAGSGPSGGPGGYSGSGPSGGPGAAGSSGPSGMPGYPASSGRMGMSGYSSPSGMGTGGPPLGYSPSGGGTGIATPGSADSSDGGAGAMGMSPYGGQATMAQMTAEQRMHDRYVDAKAQPLPGNSPQLSGEFKMMPVRMYLVMDHRRLPNLLANCANSSMPVEVLSVNVSTPGGGGQGVESQGPGRAYGPGGSSDDVPRGGSPYPTGPGGMPGSGPSSGLPGPTGGAGYSGRTGVSPYPSSGGATGYPGAMSSSYSGSPTGASGTSTGNAQPVATGPYDVIAEIQGIIFIFNPPPLDKTKLLPGSATEGSPVPPVSVPSQPTPAPSPAPPAAGTPPAAAEPAPASTPPAAGTPPAAAEPAPASTPAAAGTPPAAAEPAPASTPAAGPSGGPAAKSSAEPPPPVAAPTGGSPPAAKTP